MLGVCFKSEHRGWMQDQWSWVFSNFGITDIWERGAVHNGSRGKDGSIYQPTIKIDTAAELPDVSLVVLAPPMGKFVQGTEALDDFVHPEDAIYLFGGAQDNLSDDDLGGRTPDALVYIPLVELECYSHSAAYMTLWDRRQKRGGFG